MAIKTDAAALEAKYGGKSGGAQPPPTAEFYYPGSGKPPPGTSGPHQIPKGTPVEPGQFISQVVGRGEAAPPQMAVVPPQAHVPNQPQMAVMPPQGGSRTSIGTIVEPNRSNPLTNPTPAVEITPPEPPKAEQVEQPVPKPERKLDLAKMICDHVWELGGDKSEEAQKFYERSGTTLKNWMANPGTIPLAAILKFMHRTPGIKDMILEELEPHFEANGQEGWVTSVPNRTKTNVMICSAVLDRPTLPFTTVLGYLTKKYELGFTFQADTMIHRSRNMLAKRFLESGCLWSLWLDADIAAPIANPDWYRWITNCESVPQEYCSYDVLARMLGQSKAVIGGVYASRKWKGSLVIQPEINPRTHEDKLLCNEIRRGTARGLAEVDWIGFGCALLHREVFLEVQRGFPQLAPQTEIAPWRYFQPEGDEGEDEAFCRRVRACGIPIWLDTQLICGHIGSMAFLPEHTSPRLAL
jgi:hypothetical protein